MESRSRTFAVQVVLAVIMVTAMAWGTRYNWPDFVHVRHGLPLTWGVHTLVTIVGPVDSWSVSTQNLILDLVFWVGFLLMAPFLLRIVENRGF